MRQTLYQFGVDPAEPREQVLTPNAIAKGSEITILWISWCDLIYITLEVDGTRSIAYTGTSLNPTQQQEFTSPSSSITQALADPSCTLRFFGSTMHDGVRGYICGSLIKVFNTPAEEAGLEQSCPSIEDWEIAAPVVEITMCSNNSILASLDASEVGRGSIIAVPHLKDLRSLYATSDSVECLADFVPTQLLVNVTTATALSPAGAVYTRTVDPRYPFTLGRSYTGTSKFERVPYLSETTIKKTASGGYMTAAISDDGELFLWGQSSPGTEGELGVLQRLDYDADDAEKGTTAIWGDAVQDEDIKSLRIFIDGKAASAYDLAIGFGHILVAAHDETGAHAVFVAGCGATGQLGIGRAAFEQEFIELVVLRGKRVKQLVASGWSSFAITEDQTGP